jgi:hypothetical protein
LSGTTPFRYRTAVVYSIHLRDDPIKSGKGPGIVRTVLRICTRINASLAGRTSRARITLSMQCHPRRKGCQTIQNAAPCPSAIVGAGIICDSVIDRPWMQVLEHENPSLSRHCPPNLPRPRRTIIGRPNRISVFDRKLSDSPDIGFDDYLSDNPIAKQ